MNDKTTKLSTAIIALGILMLSIVLYSIAMTGLVFVEKEQLVSVYFYLLVVLMPACFIILPNYIAQKYNLYTSCEIKFSWYKFIFLTALLFLINLFFIKGEEFWYQMVIASCEEFLFRYCLYRILRNNFSKPQTLLICSLLFGILLHLNYDIIDNLLIRSPIGFILGLVTMRFGLHYSIAAHWLINLLAALFQ